MTILWNQLNLAKIIGSKIYISKFYKKVIVNLEIKLGNIINLETSVLTWKNQFKLGDIDINLETCYQDKSKVPKL